jgi:LysR family pca operon transcriptional activator
MIDGRIKFRHLQCFMAVAAQRSLQKAAGALSITQPAVSKTIKELEEILGVQLFERGQKGTVPTPQGEVFQVHADACLQSLQQAAASMGSVPKSASPMIKLGAVPALTACFLPQALLDFRKRVPGIQISVMSGTTSDLLGRLREREFDLVLSRHCDPEQMVGLSFEYLYVDPLVAVVRRGHPLLEPAHSLNARPGAPCINSYTAIFPVKTSANRRAADAFAKALGIEPITDFIESLSIFFGRTYTLQSDAIWFVPWSAVKHDVETGVLVKLQPQLKHSNDSPGLMARSIGLVMRSNSIPGPDTQVLINTLRDHALVRRTEVF